MGFLGDIFKRVCANLISLFISFVVMFVLWIVLVIALSGGKEPAVKDGSVLVIDLDRALMDAPDDAGVGEQLSRALGGDGAVITSVREMAGAIDAAATDSKVKAIFIHGSLAESAYGNGYGALDGVRAALIRFNKAKPSYAYLENPSMSDYYLGSAAQHLYLNGFGGLDVKGMASNSFFIGSALRKWGVDIQVFKVGKYKSALEPFVRDDMSPENREQNRRMVDEMWANVSSRLAMSRGIKVADLLAVSRTLGVVEPENALKHKLVDKLAYFDEVKAELLAVPGVQRDTETKTFNQVSIDDYIEHVFPANSQYVDGERIALVYAEGDIVDGMGNPGSIGGERMARRLRRLREDPNVKAVVFRVNSPGGSAYASEVIAREIDLLRESGRPVVVSMGKYAASGGYWISAKSDKIIAEPTTVTGSIGVFGMIPSVGKLATDVGVHFDGVSTGPLAEVGTITRMQTPEEGARIQASVDWIYERFLDRVAAGRKMSRDDVHEIAQGRVWTGTAAVKIGLVDRLGSLEDAIGEARKLAKLGGDVPVAAYPRRGASNLLEALVMEGAQQEDAKRSVTAELGGVAREAAAAGVEAQLPPVLNRMCTELRFLKTLNDPKNVYVRLPIGFSVE